MLSPEQIASFADVQAPPGHSPYLPGQRPSTEVAIVAPDPDWPATYALISGRIRAALQADVLALEHVGSTAVPGLAAKPIIDIDLTVPDSDDEAAYVPALERIGFVHVVREPWWYGHRCLRLADPRANLHVWSPHSPEAARHLIFRDWLRAHPADRRLYADAKAAAGAATRQADGDVEDYNLHKQAVIRAIYARAFAQRFGHTRSGPQPRPAP